MRLSRRYPVPPELALLYEFANSLDQRRFVHDGVTHTGGDELASLPQLEAWMHRRGLLRSGERLDATGHVEALDLRQAVRGLLRLPPPERRGNTDVAARLNQVAAHFPVVVQQSTAGSLRLQPVSGGRARGLGSILAELQQASAAGTLDRLKMCAAEECQWVFYDRSKPSTRRWCASALCGNRQKTRAYRRRQRRR